MGAHFVFTKGVSISLAWRHESVFSIECISDLCFEAHLVNWVTDKVFRAAFQWFWSFLLRPLLYNTYRYPSFQSSVKRALVLFPR